MSIKARKKLQIGEYGRLPEKVTARRTNWPLSKITKLENKKEVKKRIEN